MKRPCPGSLGVHGHIFYKRGGVLYCGLCNRPLVVAP